MGVIAQDAQMFTSRAVLTLHQPVCRIAAICLVRVVPAMNMVFHNHLAAHRTGELFFQLQRDAAHATYIGGYIVASGSITAGNSITQLAVSRTAAQDLPRPVCTER